MSQREKYMGALRDAHKRRAELEETIRKAKSESRYDAIFRRFVAAQKESVQQEIEGLSIVIEKASLMALVSMMVDKFGKDEMNRYMEEGFAQFPPL